jgi:tRNA-intron lyase
MSMIYDKEVAEKLYFDTWIGQLGKYKQEKAGSNLSLDLIETIYLMGHDEIDLKVIDATTGREMSPGELLEFAQDRHPGIDDLLAVYEDWRRSGYIVKTGFKFGAHYRIYFPGAGTGKDKWVHSKHVLHVIPKSYHLLMSEWGRIIRLSQSVKKTFILGVPALSKGDYDERERGDLVLYHRTKEGIQDPKNDGPTFLCIAIPETLRMSGLEFANALKEAEEKGLQLLIAVVDRETDINYYVARKILLEGSENEYYEIYWYRP